MLHTKDLSPEKLSVRNRINIFFVGVRRRLRWYSVITGLLYALNVTKFDRIGCTKYSYIDYFNGSCCKSVSLNYEVP